MEKGTEELKAEQYDAAIDSFNVVISEEEEAEAKNHKDELRQINNISEADRGIAIALFEQERYEEAGAYFRKVYDTAEDTDALDTPVLCRFLAICSMEAGDYETALEYLVEISETQYDIPEKKSADYESVMNEVSRMKIECYEKLADWENALGEAQMLLEKYPDDKDLKKEIEFLKGL